MRRRSPQIVVDDNVGVNDRDQVIWWDKHSSLLIFLLLFWWHFRDFISFNLKIFKSFDLIHFWPAQSSIELVGCNVSYTCISLIVSLSFYRMVFLMRDHLMKSTYRFSQILTWIIIMFIWGRNTPLKCSKMAVWSHYSRIWLDTIPIFQTMICVFSLSHSAKWMKRWPIISTES